MSFSKGGEGNSSQFRPVVMIRELGSAFLQGQIQRNGRLVWEKNFLRRACFVMFVPYRWLTCPPLGPMSTVWTSRMGAGSPMLRRFGDRDGEKKGGLAAETGSTSRSRA